jgi:Ca2+-transporting ATPase
MSLPEFVQNPEGTRGLSSDEALRILKEDGPNELPSGRRHTLLDTVFEVMKEPMFLLLLAAGSLYLILGDQGEALMLLAFVLFVIGITVFQERRVERALDALRDLSSPRALVIRDGITQRIPGREVVRGDTVVLVEGDRVPADGVLISDINLLVDESLLTGKSVPVQKVAGKPGLWRLRHL